ncbi:dynamin family protein [Bacteroides acidifaciens]|uniref:dynamin family protein n=1 Tax=Bacteroides acidifaciens TaxID=85831 RepID=UPI0025908D0A|nr:dynamin family protein [Bacteroides acidifaciens]
MTHLETSQRVKELLADLINLLKSTPWSNMYCDTLRSISQEMSNPCRLAITGRVKAGKSSLINVLLNGDYAKVGTDETTATINIFRYGKAQDETRPVLCEYTNGTSEWVSRAFLDSLQGNTKEIVSQISKIKSLTYYLSDERLKNTILIDTPGIDAVVGETGDAHQEQTEYFLGLRKQHNEETIQLSNNADAVILLLGEVSHESDIDFIQGFLQNRGHHSCINTIALLSQIDLTDARIKNREENAKLRYSSLSQYVNSVMPISAGLKRYIPSIKEAEEIKSIIGKIPSKEKLNSLLLRSEKMYLLPRIPGIDISLEERLSIYKKGEVPFRCFAVFLKIIYEYEIPEALEIINKISGIDALKEILEAQFFGRSLHIKTETAIRQALNIIWTLSNCDLLRSSQFTETKNLSNTEIEFVAENIQTIQNELEHLSQKTRDANTYFQALISLTENVQLFSLEEFEELKALFSDKITVFNNDRLNFWFRDRNNSISEIRREIAERAYNKYTDIAFN